MANSAGKGESAPTKTRRLGVHGGLIRPSVYVRRSKITISLEPSVWEAFQELAAEIEQRRIGNNLSAAIRVYIIEYYRAVISGGAALRGIDGSRLR